MPQSRALDVHCAARRVGSLSRSDVSDGEYLFGYLPDCPPSDAVSLTMPVRRDQFDSMNTVHPVFEMNLPEGALLERLRLRFAKTVPDFDDLALLEIVGRSQIGRLRFTGAGQPHGRPTSVNVSNLLTYSGTEDLFAALLEQHEIESGVSGVQPKVLVRSDEQPMDKVSARSTTHLIKSFDPRVFPELAANEYFCTRAAHHAGIPVTRLSLSENRQLLVAERFDLKPDGSYLGVEDFCVLNALRSNGRYNGSYEQIAGRIRDFVSPSNLGAALEQFFLTVALSCGIENGDAHLKNFAVIYEDPESTIKLAPAYDLVCTTVYIPNDSLALTLEDTKAFPRTEPLAAFAVEQCGLTSAKTRRLLQRVTHGIRTAGQEIQAYTAKHPDFATAAAALMKRFDRGLQRLA